MGTRTTRERTTRRFIHGGAASSGAVSPGKGALVAALLLLAPVPAPASAGDSVSWPAGEKKVVAFGFEHTELSASDLVRIAPRMEKTGVDGICVSVWAKGKDGKRLDASKIPSGRELWTREMLADQAGPFREATSHPWMRESFIGVWMAPLKRLDWHDDAVWSRIAKSMGTLAWLAKEGGFRGLCIDHEDYPRVKQHKRLPGDEPWDTLAPLARRRGREVFAEVFREYPEAVIFSYWLFSEMIGIAAADDPMTAVRNAGDLWIPFVNGILDAMPPSARLVDGNEWAYDYEAHKGEFLASAIAQRNAALSMAAPENRDKYRAQVLEGFGLYLDCYTNPKTNAQGKANYYYFGPMNGSRTAHFERNLSDALRNCGGYVWLWCEKYAWVEYDKDIPLDRRCSRELWSDRLPGLHTVLRACAKPKEFLRLDFPSLRAAGLMPNVLSGTDVAKLSREAKPSGDRRHFTVGAPDKVMPGTHYVIAAEGFGEGLSASAWWGIRLPPQALAVQDLPQGRKRLLAVLAVPERATGLYVDFFMPGSSAEGECGFDKLYLGLVPSEGKQGKAVADNGNARKE